MDRAQWNFAALMGGFIVVCVNLSGIAAVLLGKATWQEYGQIVGTVNGVAIGWVGHYLSVGGPQ